MRRALGTLRKSRLQPPRHAYVTGHGVRGQADGATTSGTVKDVFEPAEVGRDIGAHEAHWCTQMGSPLLNLVRRLDFNTADVMADEPGAEILNM